MKAMKSAKKSMKAMKKAMKSMKKRKAAMKKRTSIVAKGRGAKTRVFKGKKAKTSGGLKKADLTRNKKGKVVSRKSSEASKKKFRKNGLSKYAQALKSARKSIGIRGFVPIGGKTAKGQALLKKFRSLL